MKKDSFSQYCYSPSDQNDSGSENSFYSYLRKRREWYDKDQNLHKKSGNHVKSPVIKKKLISPKKNNEIFSEQLLENDSQRSDQIHYIYEAEINNPSEESGKGSESNLSLKKNYSSDSDFSENAYAGNNLNKKDSKKSDFFKNNKKLKSLACNNKKVYFPKIKSPRERTKSQIQLSKKTVSKFPNQKSSENGPLREVIIDSWIKNYYNNQSYQEEKHKEIPKEKKSLYEDSFQHPEQKNNVKMEETEYHYNNFQNYEEQNTQKTEYCYYSYHDNSFQDSERDYNEKIEESDSYYDGSFQDSEEQCKKETEGIDSYYNNSLCKEDHEEQCNEKKEGSDSVYEKIESTDTYKNLS